MRDFELSDHVNRRVHALSESARRRLIVAMHLVRDPGWTSPQPKPKPKPAYCAAI